MLRRFCLCLSPQVLPVTSHKRSREEMEQSAEGQQEGTP